MLYLTENHDESGFYAMKKRILLFSILCFSLTGCQATSSFGDSHISSVLSDTSVVSDIEISSITSELDLSDYTSPETGSITSQTLFENEQIRILAEGIETDSDSTYLEITIENLLQEDIVVSCSEAYINDYLINSDFHTEIPAKESLLTGINFSNADLNACDIRTIGVISFSLAGFDYDTADLLFETPYLQVETDLKDSFTQNVNTDGELLWESNNVSFILRGFSHDNDFNPLAAILIVNRSDKAIFADAETTGDSASSAYIDFGYMLPAGTQALVYVRGFDANGTLLDSLDGLSYHFMLSDGETWDDLATSDPLTF